MSYKTSSINVDDDEPLVEVDPLQKKFTQWVALRKAVTQIEERLAELRDDLMEEIPEYESVDVDEKGSYRLDLASPVETADGTVYRALKRERHVRMTLKSVEDIRETLARWEQDARVHLMKPGVMPREVYERLGERATLTQVIRTRTEEYVDQEKLYEFLAANVISDDELHELFDEKVTWAFRPIKD